MTFDTLIDRRGTHSSKWDGMQANYGVSPEEGLAMWVADMDFASPEPIRSAVRALADHGVFGYFGDDSAYRAAICWWMKERHGWTVDPKAIFTTHGLVNGVAMCLETWTDPGDGVVLFTPVYHAFARIIRASGRTVVECPLTRDESGTYQMDFAAYDAMMTGKERMVILCSPHNPGGRVWTQGELQGVADFARRNDLLLVSDEIHHDIVMPGAKHIPMPVAAPDVSDRLVLLTAASKTFNIAGSHVGNVIVHDPDLRARFAARMAGMGISPNAFGMHMVTAAYSAEGAAWVDELTAYLDENRRVFDDGVATIPGLQSMPMQATYLAWVDFSGTGMAPAEFTNRIEQGAKIAASHGSTFGLGGESFMRFNIGMPRVQIQEAVSRLQTAFSDLQ
ncbi:MalY/PatB family protein [Meridianimarinicoccus aquatilis]|uniref:cysteine-S-conjugate beta-lyase n=1 Tax=Meridianimarinicoccus aquatilis TaxID=2552766 RepID=A0A4R6AVV9_9RHOB|nr:MalY/PatB family protein [Fluviibacterium aquatile]TDL87862.1 pyridoxal phosphate-dependent aminotransferase [Fluviibacterium aquatile]